MEKNGTRSVIRARYYDATTGRWISQDPLAFNAGDSNLYRYVYNNPVSLLDPSGFFFSEGRLYFTQARADESQTFDATNWQTADVGEQGKIIATNDVNNVMRIGSSVESYTYGVFIGYEGPRDIARRVKFVQFYADQAYAKFQTGASNFVSWFLGGKNSSYEYSLVSVSVDTNAGRSETSTGRSLDWYVDANPIGPVNKAGFKTFNLTDPSYAGTKGYIPNSGGTALQFIWDAPNATETVIDEVFKKFPNRVSVEVRGYFAAYAILDGKVLGGALWSVAQSWDGRLMPISTPKQPHVFSGGNLTEGQWDRLNLQYPKQTLVSKPSSFASGVNEHWPDGWAG